MSQEFTLEQTQAWLRDNVGITLQLPPVKKTHCISLRDHQFCDGTLHFEGNDLVGPCPAHQQKIIFKKVTDEIQARALLLERLGYSLQELRQVIYPSEYLLSKLDVHRPVAGLKDMIEFVKKVLAHGTLKQNIAIFGTNGVGKTTVQLVIHFAQLEQGKISRWVDSVYLRTWFRRLISYDDEVVREAEREINKLLSADVIVWSDVGDTQSSHPTEFCESLAMLLERSRAIWVISSNLSLGELCSHQDIGPRAVSRLTGDRNGLPAVMVKLSGMDQRSSVNRMVRKEN